PDDLVVDIGRVQRYRGSLPRRWTSERLDQKIKCRALEARSHVGFRALALANGQRAPRPAHEPPRDRRASKAPTAPAASRPDWRRRPPRALPPRADSRRR